jgi:hypothetical protein
LLSGSYVIDHFSSTFSTRPFSSLVIVFLQSLLLVDALVRPVRLPTRLQNIIATIMPTPLAIANAPATKPTM